MGRKASCERGRCDLGLQGDGVAVIGGDEVERRGEGRFEAIVSGKV